MDKTQDTVAATSSVPEKIPSDQHALFREVLEAFENSGKQYAVAGAFALQKHTGIFRSTKDLDIFMSPQAARTALKDLKKTGFQGRNGDRNGRPAPATESLSLHGTSSQRGPHSLECFSDAISAIRRSV